MKSKILGNVDDIRNELKDFKNYKCVVILCKYNGGKSSIITDLIHSYFGEDTTYYVTFIDQKKPNFIPRKSRLEFGEIIEDKVIVFDEIGDDNGRDINNYLKRLIEKNLVIILSNPYAMSSEAEKEIRLFRETEREIIPENSLFLFVKI